MGVQKSDESLIGASLIKTKKLIESGVNVNTVALSGKNALFSQHCSVATAKILIENGIKINHTDSYGENALFSSPPAKMTLLIENNININQLNEDGQNILFLSNVTLNNARLLVKKNIDINNIDRYERNAGYYISDENVFCFLVKSGLDINHTDCSGDSVLFSNISTNIKVRDLLIKKGIDIHHVNYNNENILFHCTDSTENFIFYLNKGVDTTLISKSGYSLEEWLSFKKNGIDFKGKRTIDKDLTEQIHYLKSFKEKNILKEQISSESNSVKRLNKRL